MTYNATAVNVALGAEILGVGTLIMALGPNLAFMLVGWSLLQGRRGADAPGAAALLTGVLTGDTRTGSLSAIGDDRGAAGAAAEELVRINAQAREQALTLAVAGMAVMSLSGSLAALRVPRGRRPHDLIGEPPPPERLPRRPGDVRRVPGPGPRGSCRAGGDHRLEDPVPDPRDGGGRAGLLGRIDAT